MDGPFLIVDSSQDNEVPAAVSTHPVAGIVVSNDCGADDVVCAGCRASAFGIAVFLAKHDVAIEADESIDANSSVREMIADAFPQPGRGHGILQPLSDDGHTCEHLNPQLKTMVQDSALSDLVVSRFTPALLPLLFHQDVGVRRWVAITLRRFPSILPVADDHATLLDVPQVKQISSRVLRSAIATATAVKDLFLVGTNRPFFDKMSPVEIGRGVVQLMLFIERLRLETNSLRGKCLELSKGGGPIVEIHPSINDCAHACVRGCQALLSVRAYDKVPTSTYVEILDNAAIHLRASIEDAFRLKIVGFFIQKIANSLHSEFIGIADGDAHALNSKSIAISLCETFASCYRFCEALLRADPFDAVLQKLPKAASASAALLQLKSIAAITNAICRVQEIHAKYPNLFDLPKRMDVTVLKATLNTHSKSISKLVAEAMKVLTTADAAPVVDLLLNCCSLTLRSGTNSVSIEAVWEVMPGFLMSLPEESRPSAMASLAKVFYQQDSFMYKMSILPHPLRGVVSAFLSRLSSAVRSQRVKASLSDTTMDGVFLAAMCYSVDDDWRAIGRQYKIDEDVMLKGALRCLRRFSDQSFLADVGGVVDKPLPSNGKVDVPSSLRGSTAKIQAQLRSWAELIRTLGPHVDRPTLERLPNTPSSEYGIIGSQLWRLAVSFFFTVANSAVEVELRNVFMATIPLLPKYSVLRTDFSSIHCMVAMCRSASFWAVSEMQAAFVRIAECVENNPFYLAKSTKITVGQLLPTSAKEIITNSIKKLPLSHQTELQGKLANVSWINELSVLPSTDFSAAQDEIERRFRQYERDEKEDAEFQAAQRKADEELALRKQRAGLQLGRGKVPESADERRKRLQQTSLDHHLERKRPREDDSPRIRPADEAIAALANEVAPAPMPKREVLSSTLQKQDQQWAKRDLHDDLEKMLEAALKIIVSTDPKHTSDTAPAQVLQGIFPLQTKGTAITDAPTMSATTLLSNGPIMVPAGKFRDRKHITSIFLPYVLSEMRFALIKDCEVGTDADVSVVVVGQREVKHGTTTSSLQLFSQREAGGADNRSLPMLFAERDFALLKIPVDGATDCDTGETTKSYQMFYVVVTGRSGRTISITGSQEMSAALINWSWGAPASLRRIGSLNQTDQMLRALHRVRSSPYWSYLGVDERPPTESHPTIDDLSLLQPHVSKLNEAQKAAVAASYSASKFTITCIEGPPGTGKTTTICSLVSAVLAKPLKSERGLKAKPRVLICAPSNAAVDEVMCRLKSEGVIMPDGRRVMPNMIRIGVRDKVHPDILASRMFLDDRLDEMARQGNIGQGASEGQRRQLLREAAVDEAQVVCATLGALPPWFDNVRFHFAIIDEVSQSVEPQAMIPLGFVDRCVLVGDSAQLRATVLSPLSRKGAYDRSLLERLVQNGAKSHFLDLQFRMHPDIAKFISRTFYQNRLRTAGEGERQGKRSLWIPPSERCCRRFVFIDVADGREETSGSSKVNQSEARAVASLISSLPHRFQASATEMTNRIDVITFYSAQKKVIEQTLRKHRIAVDVNTVDSFQGQERDIIIVSCVRSSEGHSFIADVHRMNVALSRAREFCIVVGSKYTLDQNDHWSALIAHCSSPIE